MKIVDLKTFRMLPEGTVFAKYQPCVFDELQVKGETWDVDYLCTSLSGNIKSSDSRECWDLLESARLDSEISLTLNFDSEGRDGCFEDDQLYAVYEKKDVQEFIEKLTRCLKAYG